ncbi:DgyrCDS1252 [Dimorphilus gyrociliatus]|uniref:DgyrCDS1252 n=1 Tax=Dimorphilus gyrociliatus TaxID=2664684 RepID=A0A7I8VBT6_9ANNE|nr:DgyrCDS1252 [Dimorphilus gyrociliatus]
MRAEQGTSAEGRTGSSRIRGGIATGYFEPSAEGAENEGNRIVEKEVLGSFRNCLIVRPRADRRDLQISRAVAARHAQLSLPMRPLIFHA